MTNPWIMAARPKTLLAAFVPVLVGSSIAASENKLNIAASVTALACSILIQIGTNFTNDLYDFLKGADTRERIGPTRALNAGLVTPRQMKAAIAATFGLAFILGMYLVAAGGWIVLLTGVVSILAGLAYTAGPYPLAYNGLGDVFVFLFFGIVGTVGTYYVNTHAFTATPLFAALPVGGLITNILIVNNYRDIEQDRKAGKITLAVRLGKVFSRYEYITFIALSFSIPPVLYQFYGISGWVFLTYLSLPIAYRLISMMHRYRGSELNKTLELSAKFSMLFGLLFSLGFLL